MKEFVTRTLSGALYAIVLLGSILAGPWSFALLFALFTLFILREFYQISTLAGVSPQKVAGMVIGVVIFALTFLFLKGILPYHPVSLSLPLLFLIPILELYRKKSNALENIAVTFFGIIYVALPLSLLNFFVFPATCGEGSYEPLLLIFLVLFIWGYDSGAYLFGVMFGKHRLFERISPKKSWEGFFGGMFLALLLAVIMNHFFPAYQLTFLIPMALLVTVAGTYGDLMESMIKRNLGIKDSGKFLPGHGGLLDRFDSILFTAPFVYLVIYLLG
ncbi:MAG: phosphatidate cytidylyltransferase [Marinilabiliales bacterium]|nr:phosphatidate cytidylyltransferase [Marinilabiliales bacterium]